MALYVRNKLWPNNVVPYEMPKHDLFTQYLGELNEMLGFPLVRPKTDSDVYYLKYIGTDTGGNSKFVGTGNPGAQSIFLCAKRETFFHETLHAMGFHHEQFHRRFPWDDTEHFKPAEMWDLQNHSSQLTIAKNKKFYLAIAQKYGANTYRAANHYLHSRNTYLSDPEIISTSQCDLNSLMMYSQFREAALETFTELPEGVIQSPLHGAGPLTEADLAAVRDVYRPAARAAF